MVDMALSKERVGYTKEMHEKQSDYTESQLNFQEDND